VWIDFFRGSRTPESNYLNANLGKIEFVTGDLIVAKVLQGFRTERDFRDAKKALLSFEVYRMAGIDNAIRSAQNFRSLRDKGYTISKTIDSLIATFCLVNNFDLLHNDRDFDAYEKVFGLRVIHS
jgi:predicted nucleic acid-binding protein